MMWKKAQVQRYFLQLMIHHLQHIYIYLYRNFVEKQRELDNGDSETYYEYEYTKIKKDVYEYVKELWATEDRTTEIEDVLADLLFGGDE